MTAMMLHADSHPLPSKETYIPGQTLNAKRCASHVYIARFIEYHTNKNRYLSLLPAQIPPSHIFGIRHLKRLPHVTFPLPIWLPDITLWAC